MVNSEMSESNIKIVGVEFEEGQDKVSVRAALHEQYAGYRVAGIVRQADENNDRWVARLVEEEDRVHHKVAESDEKAPFPLKGLDGEESDDSDDEESPDDEEAPKKKNTDDDELKDDEVPAEDDKADAKDEVQELLKALKKFIPALEKIVGPMPDEVDDLAEAPLPKPEDVGPTPGNGGPGLGGPPPLPGGGPPRGGPPAPGARPPRRPGVPGGRPAGRPSVGVPTFTHVQSLVRTADVTEEQARAELAAVPELAGYEITKFEEIGGQYRVELTPTQE